VTQTKTADSLSVDGRHRIDHTPAGEASATTDDSKTTTVDAAGRPTPALALAESNRERVTALVASSTLALLPPSVLLTFSKTFVYSFPTSSSFPATNKTPCSVFKA
jgi:hypothetical protein